MNHSHSAHHTAATRRATKPVILAASIAALMFCGEAKAQFISIDSVTGNATQNFDALAQSGTGNAWTQGTTLTGWYLYNFSAVNISTYNAGTGSSNAGNFYSFGSAATPGDRALGGVASGGAYFGSPATGTVAGYVAVALSNNSGGDLTSFTLGFDGEQWRDGGATTPVAQNMTLEYGFGSTFAGVSTWIAPGGAFDWASPVFTNTSTGAAVDGNAAGLATGLGGTVSNLVWATGTTMWIRWIERNDSGNDHGLAIDNFSISWTGSIAQLLYWDLNNATAGIGGAAGVWDNAATNWSTAAAGDIATQAFTATDKAIFAGTAGDVTVGTGGVTASGGIEFQVGGYNIKSAAPADILTLGTNSSVAVTNLADTATISAPIAGTAGLIKTGPGTLVLSGTNTFTGNLNINAGTVRVSVEENLGDSTAGLVLGGGTFAPTASLTLGAGRAVSGTGTLDIAAATTLTLAGAVNTGALILSNSGTLDLTGATPSIGGLTFQTASTVRSASTLSLPGNITSTQITGTAVLDANVSVGSTTRLWTIADGVADVDFSVTGQIATGTTGTKIQKLGLGTIEAFGDQSTLGGWRLGGAGASPAASAAGGELRIDDFNTLGAAQLQFNDGTLNVVSPADLVGASAFPAGVTVSIGAGQAGIGVDGNTLLGVAAFKGKNIEFLGAASVFEGVAAAGAYQHHINASSSVIFSGGFNDAGTGDNDSTGLLIDGPGSVTFNNAANTFEKPITVDQADFAITGSLTAAIKPGITLTSDALLQAGTDLFTTPSALGALTIIDGTFAPGITGIAGLATDVPLGAVTTAALAFGAAGTLALDLRDNTLGGYDQITASGLITLAGPLQLAILDGASFTVGQLLFPIINASGSPIGGTFFGIADGDFVQVSGYEFRVSYFGSQSGGAFTGGNDLALQVAIPEPSTASALIAGLALVAFARRRRPRSTGVAA